ncbi:hypothetical protein ABPG75_004724 [Micractinium tetrahymenae]
MAVWNAPACCQNGNARQAGHAVSSVKLHVTGRSLFNGTHLPDFPAQGNQWIAFDTPRTLVAKLQAAKAEYGLGGCMVGGPLPASLVAAHRHVLLVVVVLPQMVVPA